MLSSYERGNVLLFQLCTTTNALHLKVFFIDISLGDWVIGYMC